jgi:glycosyltransferase involved in cell wall biosynthesis
MYEEAKKYYNVFIVCPKQTNHLTKNFLKFDFCFIRLGRGRINFFKDILGILQLFAIFFKFRPVGVHCFSLKFIIYGTCIAKIFNCKKIINSITGFGFLYTSQLSSKFNLIKKITNKILSIIFSYNNIIVIVQNKIDYKFCLNNYSVLKSKLFLINGSGVKLFDKKKIFSKSKKVISFGVVSRMLMDKGILDVINAAVILNKKKINFRLNLYGDVDPANPTSMTKKNCRDFCKIKNVFWHGYQSNIKKIWNSNHIAILTSYREGMSKSLLEAASFCKPIIASDIPGCRELVSNSNGFLVPVKNSIKIALFMEYFVKNKNKITSMGKKSRALIEKKFSDKIIKKKIEKIYAK